MYTSAAAWMPFGETVRMTAHGPERPIATSTGGRGGGVMDAIAEKIAGLVADACRAPELRRR